MNNLEKIINFEQELRNENHSLNYKALEKFVLENGFQNLTDYFNNKREYLFNNWKPEVYYVDITEYAKVTEEAIQSGKDGIYISNGDGIHAYHGDLPIDYDLCEELGVRVVELNYGGGTIIGSSNDFSIIIVFPVIMSMCRNFVISKFEEIISKYIPNVSIDNNDILVNGEKVAGSMTRETDKSFVWATQVSFQDYSEYIEKICQKKQVKKPAFINNTLLSRDNLEKEVLSWLQGGVENVE